LDSRTCGAGERNVLTASDGKCAKTACFVERKNK
jgi:hypothetical protein